MKAKDIRELQDHELGQKLTDLRQELFNLRFSHTTGQLNNPMQMVNCKKDIAKVLTIMRERELRGVQKGAQNGSPKLKNKK